MVRTNLPLVQRCKSDSNHVETSGGHKLRTFYNITCLYASKVQGHEGQMTVSDHRRPQKIYI
jgi:hypothetical protein